jgi:hypothetical protein
MKKLDRIYLDRFALDPDSEFIDVDDFIDFDFGNENEICQFIDEDINDLEDLFSKE